VLARRATAKGTDMTLTTRHLAAAVIAACVAAPVALADTVVVKSGGAKEGLTYKNATVTNVKDGEIYFTASSGTQTHKRVADIISLEITNETSFNTAERAFKDAVDAEAKGEATAKAKYGEAAAGYQAAVKSSKAWLRDFASSRLQIAAPKSGRFDLAVDAWIAMVLRDPAGAQKATPELDAVDAKSQYLTEGLKKLTTAKNGTSKVDEKRAYLTMIAAIQRHQGDNDGELRTVGELVQISGSPQEKSEYEALIARNEFGKKNYDAALAAIAKIDPALLSDNTRADLLFIGSEIKASKLGSAGNAEAWKDLGLEYMRVVALHPTNQNAGNALLKVAEIFETHLKEPETALKVYRQVAREHPSTPAATAAQKAIDRLAKSAASGN
jgi:tetratricopeptide (TPR) repeat protein